METVQLTLDTFDPDARPLCGDRPSANRFRRLCIRCPRAERREGNLFCGRDGQVIGAKEKYGLAAWKNLR
ncbi:MAG: HNH endonuclease, partial [Methanomicrobiaceae archaeon]|nr:HNH endonuclease [Methanomicrobiaceae archaeon]